MNGGGGLIMADAKGWDTSAEAWIASLGEAGDWARQNVLDSVMRERAVAIGGHFLDIGCGEGRFVRMLTEHSMTGIGIDPVERLIAEAAIRDPAGDYRICGGENLTFDDNQFDLTISFLALIDIPDFRAAISEMVRVTKPGGTLLIANLCSHFTAGAWHSSFTRKADHFRIDKYSQERPTHERWAGIDVINWHRPLSAYFSAFLSHGLILRHFAEPLPKGGTSEKHERYTRVPGYVVMEWQKPG